MSLKFGGLVLLRPELLNSYASADEDLLLRTMVQIFLDKSLCIAEETSKGKQLIFPCQYRRERSIPGHPEIFVSLNIGKANL